MRGRCTGYTYFNPRAPRGARPGSLPALRGGQRFQSTRPARGATVSFGMEFNPTSNFNPRAPRGARPCPRRSWNSLRCHFNPRAPRGARPLGLYYKPDCGSFQSTRPARGATCFGAVVLRVLINFNPRAPRGARPPNGTKNKANKHFNPRAPRGARQNL